MQDGFEFPWFFTSGIEVLTNPEKYRYVVLDFETTNLSKGHFTNKDNDIVLACWHIYDQGKLVAKKHQFGNEYMMEELVKDISEAQFLVAYSAKFELGWLARCGVDLRKVLPYDPMVVEWVLNGNKMARYSMEDVAAKYKLKGKDSLVSLLIERGVCPSKIPQSWLLEYCDLDVDVCHNIMQKQLLHVWDKKLEHLVLARNVVIPVLADLEAEGLQLDAEVVRTQTAQVKETLETLGEELDKITGGINLSSPKQLGKLLYTDLKFKVPIDPRSKKPMSTPSGGLPTDEKTLALLVAETDTQALFLTLYREYNKASTLLTKNLAFFEAICDEYDGVFYGQINQCRTGTHRLAGGGVPVVSTKWKGEKNIQLQNIPRGLKGVFTAHKDNWVVTEFDGAQIEFRVAADLGHDKQAESDIVNGVDIHSFTRDTMNAAYKQSNIAKVLDRQGAKSHSFAPLYGSMGKDEAEAAYAQFFRGKYHGINETQELWCLQVADKKELVTPYGIRFYWPNAKTYSSGRLNVLTEVYNLAIQGLATAEIIPLAMVCFWHRTAGMEVELFNTVHDSIIVRSPKELVPQLTLIAKQAMTLDVYYWLERWYGYKFQVPLGFGMKSDKHWGKSDVEWKWDVWTDGNERAQYEYKKEVSVLYDTRNGDKVVPFESVTLD